MFERFTDRARKVMALANQEAQRFNHEYIGTEHILLGLVKEGSGVGANVLKNLDVDLRKVRLEVEKLVKTSAFEPKATRPIESPAGFVVTNVSAAAAASAIDCPAIERERSTASTTLVELPRLTAWALLMTAPFSETCGCCVLGEPVTTETPTCG